MTVAMTAEALPVPNSSSAGIRYTKTGIVCMVSSTGRTSRLARSDAESSTPAGRPSSSAISTLAITMESVSSIMSQ